MQTTQNTKLLLMQSCQGFGLPSLSQSFIFPTITTNCNIPFYAGQVLFRSILTCNVRFLKWDLRIGAEVSLLNPYLPEIPLWHSYKKSLHSPERKHRSSIHSNLISTSLFLYVHKITFLPCLLHLWEISWAFPCWKSSGSSKYWCLINSTDMHMSPGTK